MLRSRPLDHQLQSQTERLLEDSLFLRAEYAAALIGTGKPHLMAAGLEKAFVVAKLSPSNPSHRLAAAVALDLTSKFAHGRLAARMRQQALANTVASLRCDMSYWPAHENLAFLLHEQGKAGEAIQMARNALRWNPLAVDSVRLISGYQNRSRNGERFFDGSDAEIPPDVIQSMHWIIRGIATVHSLDLPLVRVRDDQLHGWAPVSFGQVRNRSGNNAIHLLVDDWNAVFLEYMGATYDLDWTLTNEAGETPMHQAIRFNEPALVDVLLRSGATCDLETASGINAIRLAAQLKQHGIVLRLLSHESCSSQLKDSIRPIYGESNELGGTRLRALVYQRFHDEIVESAAEALIKQARRLGDPKSADRQPRITQSLSTNDVVPVSNEPFLLPPGIAMDWKANPAHALARIRKKMSREVEQMIAQEQASAIASQAGLGPQTRRSRASRQTETARREILRSAVSLAARCAICLQDHEFDKIQRTQLKPLFASLEQHQLHD